MSQKHNILGRLITFLGRESGHQWSVERIRSKLSVGLVDFAAEAERLTEAEFGPATESPNHDEDEDVERQLRVQSIDDYMRMLELTESYLWGLGIAGIYHQFERDVREVVGGLLKPKPHRLQTADFDKLCSYLNKLGYSIKDSKGFDGLDVARLIANAVKHGEGVSFVRLATERPDLFPEHQKYLRYGRSTAQPDFDDLRVGGHEFDQAASAISVIWPEMEEALSSQQRKGR